MDRDRKKGRNIREVNIQSADIANFFPSCDEKIALKNDRDPQNR